MTGNWVLFTLTIGALMSCAAWLSARAAIGAGRPSRWCWFFAGILTVILPIKAFFYPTSETSRNLLLGLEWQWPVAVSVTPSSETGAPTAVEGRVSQSARPDLAMALWATGSVVVLCWLLLSHRQLALARRSWTRDILWGTPVRLSNDFGPAVVGILQPEVVLPRWVLGLPAEEIDLILRHELEHVEQMDPRLLGMMTMLVLLVPWHPFLWLQLRGLRMAIEFDCDRRVVPVGGPVRSYGELLLSLAGRVSRRSQHAWILPLAGFWPARSSLEQRIRQLTATRRPGSMTAAGFVAGFVVSLAACAAHPPVVTPESQGSIMQPERPWSEQDERIKEQDDLESQLAANFPAPTGMLWPDSARVYWLVREENGAVVRRGEGGREILWWSEAAFRKRWPRIYNGGKSEPVPGDRPAPDYSHGVYMLGEPQIYERFPDLNRKVRMSGMGPARFGADTVMFVWALLEPMTTD